MNAPHDEFGLFSLALVLLAAAVISVPIAKQFRLSAIVAYLAAGIVIGPFGIGVFRAPETILAFAELGVVLLLFIIGLELKPSQLFAMRRDIFGFGAAQLALTALTIGGLAYATGLLAWRGATVAGLGLAISSTAIALNILEQRGHLQRTYGQRVFAVLLFQDMAILPLLALIPLLADSGVERTSIMQGVGAVAKGAAAIAAIVLAGRFLLNPFFRLLANSGAREAMTAAALLVVLGAALLMHAAGMSMALGAFLAGVLLAESNYRHELEADIDPFRGLLLALFFMGVGMGIDLDVLRANVVLVLAAAVVVTLLKLVTVWGLFRGTCEGDAEAIRTASLLTSASEFAFVLIPAGLSLGMLSNAQASLLTAIAAITMMLGPPTAAMAERVLRRSAPRSQPALDDFGSAGASVLLLGFGRFGQIVSQCLLAQELDVTIIEYSAERIRNASDFGFKIYYGDATRLDVLRAAGAARAQMIAVCIDRREDISKIADMARAEFPQARLFVRSYDRTHTLELLGRGVDYEIRETYESAILFGQHALEALGSEPELARAVVADVRRRDAERLAVQQEGGLMAGMDILHRRGVQPAPLSPPERQAQPLNPEAEDIMSHETEFSS